MASLLAPAAFLTGHGPAAPGTLEPMLHALSAPFRVIGRAVRDWWRDWVNMAALNLAWLLCWLSVVLGPPATFALYDIVHQYVHGRSFELRETPALLRRYALKSWLWLLGNAFVAGGLWLNLQFYTQGTAWAAALRAFSVLAGALWLAVQFYALPYLFEQDRLSLRRAWRNAFLTVLASPLYTLVVVGFALLLVVVGVRVVVFLFLGLPPLIAVLGVHAVAERLEHYRIRGDEA